MPKSPKTQNKSIKWQEMVASNLPNRKTSQSPGKEAGCPKSPKTQNKSIKRQRKRLPQISQIAKQVNHPANHDRLKSPKSQNKSIKRQQMVASNLQNCRNKSIKWQEMVASNLQNCKTSQSPGKKWLPQISQIAKQVNHPAGNGCLKSPKTQNKSNILSHIG